MSVIVTTIAFRSSLDFCPSLDSRLSSSHCVMSPYYCVLYNYYICMFFTYYHSILHLQSVCVSYLSTCKYRNGRLCFQKFGILCTKSGSS